MNITELIALFPRKARKIPSADVIRLLNGPVFTDLYDMILTYAPNEFKGKDVFTVIKQEALIDAFAAGAGLGYTTVTAPAHGYKERDIVQVLSDSYIGVYCIENVTTDTFDIEAAFTATELGNSIGPAVHNLPDGLREITAIEDLKYGEVFEAVPSVVEVMPMGVQVVGDQILIPAMSPLTRIEVSYERDIATITNAADEIPLSDRVLSAVKLALVYGVCLYFYRERKKATEMQIYLDLYNEAKGNRVQEMSVLEF